ncbi:RING-H2 zinc finger protein isoform X2 [Tasmannia lanceolata]|uniref:RING-H2 zinc finger protein isoform X2 n=1 Tax=Tasmannia lanceolata TaxID=3420 RepID=UPI00406390E0
MSPATSSSAFPDLPSIFLFAALSTHFLFSKPLKIYPPSLLPFAPQNPRRLILKKNPTTMSENGPPTIRFSSPQSLSDWLKPRLPSESFSSWGLKSGTKNVHNLYLELSQGETSLADSTPPIRTVHVATIRIRTLDNSKTLIESHQELSNGSVRPRLRPLSEKMKPGETVDEAVLRAVREELGSLIPDSISSVRIVPGSYRTKVEERVSVSYPGLPACYVLHSVDAWVHGLPDGEFWTEEEEYGECSDARVAEKAVFVKKHFWKWVSVEGSS